MATSSPTAAQIAAQLKKLQSKGKTKARSMTIPVAMVVGMMPALDEMWNHRSSLSDLTNVSTELFLGYDRVENKFKMARFKKGTLAIALGYGVHKLAQRFGINRAIARAGIPFIRI